MGYYGIDLGTSNCLVAELRENFDESFEVVCLSDTDGNESFPSIVYFENESEYKVGNSASEYLTKNPKSSVELVKIRLGKADEIEIITEDTKLLKSPQEITSYILKHFNVLHNNEVKDAVITVPAFFDQNKKEATMQSAFLANIKPMSLLEEPTAAIMYQIFSEYNENKVEFFKDNKEKNVLVFDFGGGTLDLSLINIKKENNQVIPKVLAIGGDSELGGNVIDFVFTKVIIDSFHEKYNDDFTKDVYTAFNDYYNNYMENGVLKFKDGVADNVKKYIFTLKNRLEIRKKMLSEIQEVTILFNSSYDQERFTRTDFEETVLENDDLNIKERVRDCLSHILDITDCSIHEVLLVGGSSQIPYLRKIIVNTLKQHGITDKNIKVSNDFDRAVVKGAAIHAAISSGVAVPPFINNTCQSIVPRNIYLKHINDKALFVSRGKEYPFAEKVKYDLKIAHSLAEAVSIQLYEGNGDVNDKFISGFKFYLPFYYTDDVIAFKMNIDKAGLYQIEATYENTNETVEFNIEKEYTLTVDEMKKIKSDIENVKDISSI